MILYKTGVASIFPAIRERIRTALAACFAIVRCMHWVTSVAETILIRRRVLRIAQIAFARINGRTIPEFATNCKG